MTALALLSDIHGNLPAFEAVAAEIAARRPDAVYVLGDMVNGLPWPAEVLDRLLALGWPMLLGNHDDAVLQLGTPRMEPRYRNRQWHGGLWWARERLSERHLRSLAALPLDYRLIFPAAPPLRLLHGLPGNFFVGFRPDSPADWSARHLRTVEEPYVAGGHTHVPMARRIAAGERGWLVLNSGSTGVSYDGDPRANYLWLEGGPDGWRVEIRRVDYDRGAVEQGFRGSTLAREGNALSTMFLRSALTGQPWVADFAWWLRKQYGDAPTDMIAALQRYDAAHGPGRWAFPIMK